MNLSQVSRTAISTLISRAVESQRKNGDYSDPMAALCLERLLDLASAEEQAWILRQKRLLAGFQAVHAKALVRRVSAFDRCAARFISDHPKCTVINLACGFDTRFWRVKNEGGRYIEIDLPEVVALKREVLKDQLRYELLGCSVLEAAWIDQVTAQGSSGYLLLAEGLFMYLPKAEVTALLQRLTGRFDRSQLVVEVVSESFTRGLWKALMALETRVTWGLETTYVFGLKRPRDLETYAPGLKVVSEEKAGMGLGAILTLSINAALG
jgi:O-methyltransferase involved in polyketide biosynthesis